MKPKSAILGATVGDNLSRGKPFVSYKPRVTKLEIHNAVFRYSRGEDQTIKIIVGGELGSAFRETFSSMPVDQGEEFANDSAVVGIFMSRSIESSCKSSFSVSAEIEGIGGFRDSLRGQPLNLVRYCISLEGFKTLASSEISLRVGVVEAISSIFDAPVEIVVVGALGTQTNVSRDPMTSSFLSRFADLSDVLRRTYRPRTHYRELERALTRPEINHESRLLPVAHGGASKGLFEVWRSLVNFAFLFASFLVIPLVAVSALLIGLEDGRPVIFVQRRLGLNGVPFPCLKLRTMQLGTPSVPSHAVSSDSLLKIGNALRSLKLDEIPQAVNVLRGEMNLIGYRPSLLDQHEVVAQRSKFNVASTKPGLTGLAQVCQADMSRPVLLAECDRIYQEFESVSLDMQILARTFLRTKRQKI